jgi:hypothetical protein
MTPRWSKIKKALSGESNQSLLRLIKDLYDLRPENKTFLEARLAGDVVDIGPYRRRVEGAISPDPLSRKDIRITAARQAVREYGKAVSDPLSVADLMLYYVECGTWYAADLGYGDERYFASLEGMFADMLRTLNLVDGSARGPIVERIEAVLQQADRTGWGYGDELRYQFEDWLKRAY